MVILGGAGSQAGVVLGAVIVSVLLEALRDPGDSRGFFYVLILLSLVAVYRTSTEARRRRRRDDRLRRRCARSWRARSTTAGPPGRSSGADGSRTGRRTGSSCPTQLAEWVGPVTYIALVALALLLTLVGGWVRIALLVPTLYLASFVWENVMLPQPESTRYIVLGALLVAMMIARPQGLLGEKRVEIV